MIVFFNVLYQIKIYLVSQEWIYFVLYWPHIHTWILLYSFQSSLGQTTPCEISSLLDSIRSHSSTWRGQKLCYSLWNLNKRPLVITKNLWEKIFGGLTFKSHRTNQDIEHSATPDNIFCKCVSFVSYRNVDNKISLSRCDKRYDSYFTDKRFFYTLWKSSNFWEKNHLW